MSCPFCKASHLIEIGMVVQGRRVTMHSCSVCERRWWDREGEQLPLRSVLDMVSVH